MAWIGRSLANSLHLDEHEVDDGDGERDGIENDIGTDRDSPRFLNLKHETWEKIQLPASQSSASSSAYSSLAEEGDHARGVKEDLDELGESLTRQFWGVASFLAPPPSNSDAKCDRVSSDDRSDLNQFGPSDRSNLEPADLVKKSDIVTDSQEACGGRFQVEGSEVSQMVSSVGNEENQRENLVIVETADEKFEEEEEGGGGEDEEYEEEEEEEEEEIIAVGITDEVLAFAKNIAMHPETWLDFPLDPEDDLDDFDMSDAQRGHTLAIERFSPRLAALRIELCPCFMSESNFWKVYFVLLHSRLNKHDAGSLSSPQVMEARKLWMKELQQHTNPETFWPGRTVSSLKDKSDISEETSTPSSNYYAPPEFLSPRIYSFEPPSLVTQDHEIANHWREASDSHFIDKAVIEEDPVSKTNENDLRANPSPKAQTPNYEHVDEDDDWPEEEDSAFEGCPRVPVFTGNEEDVSFSDLEGDDDISSLCLKSKMASKGSEHPAM